MRSEVLILKLKWIFVICLSIAICLALFTVCGNTEFTE